MHHTYKRTNMRNLFITIIFSLFSFGLLATQDSTSVIMSEPVAEDLIAPWPPYYGYGQYEAAITSWSTSTTEEFSTPLYVTFTVEKQLKKEENGRINIGLGFGLLNVKGTFNEDYGTYSVSQNVRRSFAAVPVYAKYNFIQKQKVNVYASLGVTAEFGINGKSETTTSYENGTSSFYSEKFPLGLGQFNTNLGTGVSYSPLNKLNVFCELNAARYFNHEFITIWDEKEIWLNLKTGIGLRF